MKGRASFSLLAVIALAAGAFAFAGSSASAAATKVTICHRTNSDSNPYVEISPSANGVLNGHAEQHDDLFVWTPTLKATGQKWGDIIPAFDFGPGAQYAGKNWTAAGQAIQANDCTAPDAIPTTTTSTTPPEDTTTTESTTTTSTVAVSPITTGSAGTVPVGNQGGTDPSTPVAPAAVPGAGSGTLPFTGSPVVFLLSLGGALIASGIGLIARRRHWAN